MATTAWGNAIVEFGTPGAGNTMSTELKPVGYVLEDTLAIEKEDGTELQLFEEGHILRDQLQQEGVVRISGTLIGIPDDARTAFWDVTSSGSDDAKKVSVKSLISSKKYSTKLSVPQVPGSETLEAPYCSVSLGMAYSSTQGWTAPFTITILKGETGKLFDFGVVAAV